MTLGLASKLNVLRESPLDHLPPQPLEVSAPADSSETEHWVGSRFNVQTTTDDGRLIVWNTFRGSMSVFQPA